MGKNILKGASFLYFLCICAVVFAGCGQKGNHSSKEENKKRISYTVQEIRSGSDEGYVQDMYVQDDTLFFCTEGVWSVNLKSLEEKEMMMPQLPEHAEICCFYMGSSQKIWLLCLSTDDTGKSGKYGICQYDETGTLINEADISEVLKPEQGAHVVDLLVDEAENVILITDKVLYFLDSSLKLQGQIKTDYYIDAACMTKKGVLYIATTEQGNAVVKQVDMEKEKIKGSHLLSCNFLGNHSLIGGDALYDFYFCDTNGIHGYRIEDKTEVLLVDYVIMGLEPKGIDMVVPAGGDSFAAIQKRDGAGGSIILLKKTEDPTAIHDKEDIVLGAVNVLDDIQEAAANFNRSNHQYRVIIKDYSKEADPHTAFINDIISGNAPDVLCMDETQIMILSSNGLLEDLEPYYQRDPDVSLDDIIDSVADGMRIDGKVRYVSPSFAIHSIIARSEDVDNLTGWDMKDFMAVLENKPEDVKPFYSASKEMLLKFLMGQSVSLFIDWQTGKCSFDSDECKAILEYCNSGVDNESAEETDTYEYEHYKMLKTGEIFLEETLLNLDDLSFYMSLMGDDITCIGYPCENRQGTYFEFQSPMGIYAKSNVKEGAWDFIKTFMTKEFQYEPLHRIFINPTRKDNFEMLVKEVMATSVYIDEMGNEKPPYNGTVTMNGDVTCALKPLKENQVKLYRDFIDNTHRVSLGNSVILSIVMEEAQTYFKGDKSLEEAAEIMNNRISTYVNENR